MNTTRRKSWFFSFRSLGEIRVLLANAVIKSSLWSLAGFSISQALRLGSNLILTRLLFPEAFGLMALVSILIAGIEMFTDLGVGASIIQNKRAEEAEFYNTAWTIKVVRGAAIFVCIGLLATPFSWFYDEPKFIAIVPVAALGALITGFASVAPAIAMRKLWIGRATVMTLGCQVVTILVMFGWAWVSPTVWALVAGNLANTMAQAVVSHFLFPNWRMKFQWNADVAREIVRFGKWIFLTSMLTFIAAQIDRLTLAKLVPLAIVGVYSIAYMWATLPHQLVLTWSGRVFFPLASSTLRETDGDKRRLVLYRRRVLWLSAAGIGLFGGLSAAIFHLLYTREYWKASEFVTILLVGTIIKVIDELYRSYNLALGQPMYNSIGSALSILVFGAAVFPLFEHFSGHGVAMAFSLSQLGTLAATVFGLRKTEFFDIGMDIAALGGAVAIWAALYFTLPQFT